MAGRCGHRPLHCPYMQMDKKCGRMLSAPTVLWGFQKRGGNLPPAVFCYEKYTVFGLSHPGALQQGGVGGGKGGLFFGFIQGQQ